ncbi:MAG: ABC transporter substrate-binding protein, partial [Candidatus Saccharibacteria bacterium]|nr:ABC transporter substrate-binding protein [Pseudorhodobacter sp.]
MLTAAAGALAAGAAPLTAFAQDAAAAVEITPATPMVELPREAQAILGWSMTSPVGVTNPWAVPGYTHQEGNAFMWEPLMYFGIFKDDYIPWLATSMEYTAPDFTSLQIKINPAAKWSDGVPVTAKDVVFTFEGQMKNNKLPYHAAFDQFMESATATDELTVDVKFKIPAPRFKFEVLCEKFDTGIPIVPAHAFDGQADVNALMGGAEMPHSGPYDLIAWNSSQKIFNLREDWWAVGAGLIALPDVKRIIISNLGGQVGQNMDTIAQRIVNNEMDSALDMRSSVIGNILAQNPKITTHTGNASPYGYLDWWPNSLWMNTQLAPYDDKRVRRAISLAINRDLINDTLYEGAKIATIYPFPLYPGLQAFVDSPEMKALEEKLKPGLYDVDASAALMTEAGFVKNGKDLWEKDGATVNCTINGFEGIHSDIGPILVEFLLAAGFDAAVNFGTNAYQNMSDGVAGLYLFGHGASLKDPYAALELFHGRFSNAIGTSAGNNR